MEAKALTRCFHFHLPLVIVASSFLSLSSLPGCLWQEEEEERGFSLGSCSYSSIPCGEERGGWSGGEDAVLSRGRGWGGWQGEQKQKVIVSLMQVMTMLMTNDMLLNSVPAIKLFLIIYLRLAVTCHMSCVMCHLLPVMFFLFFFGQSGGASRWRVCYQQGLPRLVFPRNSIQFC